MTTPAILDKVDVKEVMTDTAGMVGFDALDTLSISGDVGFLGGVGVANAVWQGYGRNYVARNVQPITVGEIIGGKAGSIAESDVEYLALKGVIYSVSIYATSVIINGVSNRRPLITCILDGFVGGQLGGYLLRQPKKQPIPPS